jgi:hypothetical protein
MGGVLKPKIFSGKYHGGSSGSPPTRRALRERIAEVGQNSIKIENREAMLVPRRRKHNPRGKCGNCKSSKEYQGGKTGTPVVKS